MRFDEVDHPATPADKRRPAPTGPGPADALGTVSPMGIDAVVEVAYGHFLLLGAGVQLLDDAVPDIGWQEHLWSDGVSAAVVTARTDGPVPVRIEVLADAPSDGELPPEWMHVAECSLDPAGRLAVVGWDSDDPVATVSVGPGPQRLRVGWTGLVEGLVEGVDGEGRSDEAIHIQVWPAPIAPTVVVRWWEGRIVHPPDGVAG